MKITLYFVLVVILLTSHVGCSRYQNITSKDPVDRVVSVNEGVIEDGEQVDTENTDVESTSVKSTVSKNESTENVNSEDESAEDVSEENVSTEDVSAEDVSEENVSTEDVSTEDVSAENESAENKSIENKKDENTDFQSTDSGITNSDSNENVNSETRNKNDSSEDIEKSEYDKNEIIEKQGLVELIKLDHSFVIDIKYATEDNFTKKKIYSLPMCLIHKNTAKKLIAANNEFKELGYSIKVFDAYRPYSAQQVMWDSTEDKSYLANPKRGSNHNRGAAVDVTLVDEKGQELEMPSEFDEFSERSHLSYNQCDEQLITNRELLGKIMIKHGFKRISTEWWHFNDTDASKYPLLDISFEEFIQD